MSIEAERELLGAILIEPSALLDAMEVVGSECFTAETHRKIYRAMVEIDREGETVDIITVSDRLNGSVKSSYLGELITQTIGPSLVKSSAQSILTAYHHRELDEIFTSARTRLHGGETVPQVVSWVDSQVTRVMDASSVSDMKHIAEVGVERWADYQHMKENPNVPQGIPSGFDRLDQTTGGFAPNEMTVLAARPAVGKSAIAINIALAAAEAGYKVAYFSLEMDAKVLFDRAMSATSRVNVQALRVGRLDKWTAAEDGLIKLSGLPFYLSDQRNMTSTDIKTQCRRLSRGVGLDLVIVDYLGLLGDKAEAGEQRYQVVGRMTKTLRNMLPDFGGSLLLLHQLSRANVQEKRRPSLHDLRESGNVEQDADTVIFLHPTGVTGGEGGKLKEIELIIGKNRNGPENYFPLWYEGHRTKFHEQEWRI